MPSQLALFSEAGPVRLSRTVPPPASPNSTSTAAQNQCRFCGCQGDSCLNRSGDRCDWLDSTHTVCTGEACRARLAQTPSPKPVASASAAKPVKRRRRSHWGSRAAWENYLNR